MEEAGWKCDDEECQRDGFATLSGYMGWRLEGEDRNGTMRWLSQDRRS